MQRTPDTEEDTAAARLSEDTTSDPHASITSAKKTARTGERITRPEKNEVMAPVGTTAAAFEGEQGLDTVSGGVDASTHEETSSRVSVEKQVKPLSMMRETGCRNACKNVQKM